MKLNQSELANLIGVKRQYIGKIKNNKIILNKDGLFDSSEKLNRDFLISKGINPKTGKPIISKDKVQKQKKPAKKPKQTTKSKAKTKAKKQNPPVESSSMDFEMLSGLPEKYKNMTMEKIIMQHGTIQGFKMHVDIMNKIFTSMKIDVEIKEKRKELVPRAFIEFLKFYVDDFVNKLFDYADSCVIDIIPMIKTDEDKAKIRIPEMLRKNFSKYAQETQRNIKRKILALEKEKEKELDKNARNQK